MPRKSNTAVRPDVQRRWRAAPQGSSPVTHPPIADIRSEVDLQRLLQEQQVNQIELEVQNSELQDARGRMENLLEKYTDLYDFAPVGYFSLDERERIIEANLTGAALLGIERSRLIGRPLSHFVCAASRPVIAAFLERAFAGPAKQVCEAALLRQHAAPFWASFHGSSTTDLDGPEKWCRIAISDITSLKQAEEAQRRMEVLAVANRELRREIIQRQKVERALKKSEHHTGKLLKQSGQMQERLRQLSRQVLFAQEQERKKISRELHDVIAQTLANINIRLSNLKREAALGTADIEQSIASTQQVVEQSVNIVHRFARELRPTVLDDVGLIPALHTFMKGFSKQTGIRVSLAAFAAVEEMTGDKRTVLYRVAQEALINVARHAHANRVQVKIEKLENAVRIRIKDNGRGFRDERLLRQKPSKRLGLLGMRERVEMVNGNFLVKSSPGRGTTVQVQIPLGRDLTSARKTTGDSKT